MNFGIIILKIYMKFGISVFFVQWKIPGDRLCNVTEL